MEQNRATAGTSRTEKNGGNSVRTRVGIELTPVASRIVEVVRRDRLWRTPGAAAAWFRSAVSSLGSLTSRCAAVPSREGCVRRISARVPMDYGWWRNAFSRGFRVRKKIGECLIQAGLITEDDLGVALEEHKRTGERVGVSSCG